MRKPHESAFGGLKTKKPKIKKLNLTSFERRNLDKFFDLERRNKNESRKTKVKGESYTKTLLLLKVPYVFLGKDLAYKSR